MKTILANIFKNKNKAVNLNRHPSTLILQCFKYSSLLISEMAPQCVRAR